MNTIKLHVERHTGFYEVGSSHNSPRFQLR